MVVITHCQGVTVPCTQALEVTLTQNLVWHSHSDLTQVAILVLDHVCVFGPVEGRHRLGIVLLESDIGISWINGDRDQVDDKVEQEDPTSHLGSQGAHSPGLVDMAQGAS